MRTFGIPRVGVSSHDKGSSVLDRSKVSAGLVVHRVWVPEHASDLRRPIAYVGERRRRIIGVVMVALAVTLALAAVVGLIAFLIGLLLLLVAYMALFVGPPNPNLALTGGGLTLIGALALAKRYRLFAVLVACFAVPVGIIGAFVLWPPSFWLLLALGFGWLLVRRWRHAHPRQHA